jgi:hypothetical protein
MTSRRNFVLKQIMTSADVLGQQVEMRNILMCAYKVPGEKSQDLVEVDTR